MFYSGEFARIEFHFFFNFNFSHGLFIYIDAQWDRCMYHIDIDIVILFTTLNYVFMDRDIDIVLLFMELILTRYNG